MSFSELLNSIWLFLSSFSWAIPTALLVYIGQKFIVPQVLELREVIKRARYAVIYYANVFPINQIDLDSRQLTFDETSKELRVISARLRASRDNIPYYSLVEKTGLVPTWKNVEEAAIAFIGWSNEIYSLEPGKSGRQAFRKRIAKLLDMKSC